MAQQIITKENYDAYKSEVERLSERGMSQRDIVKKLPIGLDYVGRMLQFDTYEEFRDFFRGKAKERYYRRKQQEVENAEAREWSKTNQYQFGQKVKIERKRPVKYKKSNTIINEVAWKLIGKYPNDEDVRTLIKTIVLREKGER